ncbi:MAG: TonB-dependent receptor [Candidatus Eisenbacteria bacterium]|nr:TonB-dependent receptor [Candidatus Latescibacterota bacterium]MBD3301120.1 TonB-dependent receptor [Candidatus Eisenbacteria bacterium]
MKSRRIRSARIASLHCNFRNGSGRVILDHRVDCGRTGRLRGPTFMLRTITWICLLTLTPLPLSRAQGAEPTEAEDVHTLGEVVVRATRPVATVGGSSAVEAQIDSLPVPAAATVEEVFRELPLLHVRTNSRGEAEISARGSESRQVAVLVDGVPITLAWDARADVSVIPATAMHDVTFTRGLSSMLYGPNVLGGIVEVSVGQLRHQPAERTLQVTMGADHVGTVGTAVMASIPGETGSGQWLARAGAGFRTTPGDPLADGIREATDPDDSLRLNTDAENADGFLALRYRENGGAWLSFSGSTFREERGIAAELGLPDADARLWRYPHVSRTIAVLSGGTGFRKSPFGGHGDVEASLGIDVGRTEIDAYATRDYDTVTGFEDGEDRTVTLRLLADQTLGTRGDLRAAFTLSDIHHDESIPDGDFAYRQRLLSLGLESVWRVLRSRGPVHTVSLSVGGAYDRAETPETGGRPQQDPLSELGGRVGLSAVLGEDERTVLHAGVSRRGRFPALRELYSGALDRFLPNPHLEPEKLLTVEAGATRRIGTGEIQAVAFHSYLKDAVVRTTLDDGTRRFLRVNRDELRSTGLEILGAGALGPVELAGNATFQSVELTDTEAAETHRPEDMPEIFGDLSVRFPLLRRIIGRIDLQYTGEQYAINAITGDDARLPDQGILGASISRRWPLRVSWGGGVFTGLVTRLAVDNAGDVALYDAWGLPGPGRRVRLEVRLR